MMFGKWIGIAAAAAVLAGCDRSPVAPDAPPALPPGVTFVTTGSGLRYADVRVGTGTLATTGRNVAVHYIGWLEDGERFDTSFDGQPLTFTLGQQGTVIPGWQEGIRGMRVGGRRRLVIPPSLGYGDQEQGSIPPNSTLVFDVILYAVR
jgi:FKBP-type peptidyl-prolyl cis-trans isomerase